MSKFATSKLGIFTNKISKVGKVSSRIWLLSSVFVTLLLILYVINTGVLDFSGQSAEQLDLKRQIIGCSLTKSNQVIQMDRSPLKTITKIGSISYETEVFKTKLAKHDIPALSKVYYTDYVEMDNCLENDDELVIVQKDNIVKAYPKRLLIHHSLINDYIAGIPILISRCNLCDSYAVYIREYRNEELFFGVSGQLYKNNDLIFDHKTESLWTQFDARAKIGTMTDASLEHFAFKVMKYSEMKNLYKNPRIASFDTGHIMNYFGDDPYKNLQQSSEYITTVFYTNNNINPKEHVLAFFYEDEYYAIRLSDIINVNKIFDLNGKSLRVLKFQGSYEFMIDNQKQENIFYRESQWYVWYDFFPQTRILSSN
jgi:hypothetical protein